MSHYQKRNLYQIIEAAAKSMDPAPLIVWGENRFFNQELDNAGAYEWVLCVLPASGFMGNGGNNTLIRTEVQKVLVMLPSDQAANTGTDRKWNIEAAEEKAAELYARMYSLAQDLQGIKLFEFQIGEAITYEGSEGLVGYFNLLDSQMDGIGVIITTENRFPAPVCMEGPGRVLVAIE